MATLLAILETLAYAIARGVTRAYLDVLREQTTATKEAPTDEDRSNADVMRNAANGVPRHPNT